MDQELILFTDEKLIIAINLFDPSAIFNASMEMLNYFSCGWPSINQVGRINRSHSWQIILTLRQETTVKANEVTNTSEAH